ncbi:MAG: DUF1667 domain-containing protein [Spirochaetales bacterium]|jgi:CxxC motif-containing protein|nr:DUF1667 domain-containing protein [Spirochaetales bacterium]
MKEMICIVCPRGCRLRGEEKEGIVRITGNQCSKGLAFGEKEITDPRRTLTTTVKTIFPGAPVLPVRTDAEIPKARMREFRKALNEALVSEPLGIGEVVCQNFLGLGANVIASSNILRELS